MLFFTSVDSKYKRFILPYVFFAHAFNPFAKFEIVFRGNDIEFEALKQKIEALRQLIDCEILIRKPKIKNLDIHKIRFYEEPVIRCEYTYCGDIDILILESISAFHITQMELYDTMFDNVIRYNNPTRLSGLHFVDTERYYKATLTARSSIMDGTDEDDLMQICKKSNLKFKPPTISIADFNISRPDHGFHISSNRRPFAINSPMSIDLSIEHFKVLENVFKDALYQKVSDKLFDTEFKSMLNMTIEYIKNQKFDGNDTALLTFAKTNKKYVIYSCQIGKYDNPMNDNVYDTENFDYFYFTDDPCQKIDKEWKIVDTSKIEWIFPKSIKNDNTRKARFIKTHPHLFFENYEKSIWIDAHLRFVASPKKFIDEIGDQPVFVSVKHPYRTCIYQEAEELKTLRKVLGQIKDDPAVIESTIECIRHNGYPSDNGLIESGVMIRKHNDPQCIFIMRQWWEMIEKYSKRDQLSFNYIQWKNQFPYRVISHAHRCEYIKQLEHLQ